MKRRDVGLQDCQVWRLPERVPATRNGCIRYIVQAVNLGDVGLGCQGSELAGEVRCSVGAVFLQS